MHGHHPDRAAGPVHLALDLDPSRLDPGDEPCEGRGLVLLVVQGLDQQLVDRILGFGTEPCQQTPPPVVMDKRTFAD